MVAMEGYPASIHQETLLCFRCKSFEMTGTDHISVTCLENPATYAKHKRSLGLFGKGSKGKNKIHYVILARSTNRPLSSSSTKRERRQLAQSTQDTTDAGYDKMFTPGDEDDDLDMEEQDEAGGEEKKDTQSDENDNDNDNNDHGGGGGGHHNADMEEAEISSFPALVCLTFNSDGSNPDIRKLVELDQLTTVQDMTATQVQLAFQNGDTIRFDFTEDDEDKVVESGLQKERFIWSL